MTGTGDPINLADWCPTCHRRLHRPDPGTGHDDDLLYLDPATGRWRHTLCHIAHRKETTTN